MILKKFFIVISLVLISLFTFNTNVSAATDKVAYVTTSIGEDGQRQMLVNYHAYEEGTVVEYTVLSDTSYANKVTVTPTSYSWSYKSPSYSAFRDGFVCKATLDDLTPDTEYRYRIRTASGATSNEYFFKTAPERGTFTFAFLTDSQAVPTQYNIFNTLVGKAKELRPDTAFVFHTGDVTDRGGQPEQWNGFYNQATNLSLMPIASTPGNHEYYLTNKADYISAEVYNQFFNNPQNGPESTLNSSYYFTYGNALFVMLDTIKTSNVNDLKDWFVDVVSNNMRRVIIVGMHIGPFTGGGSYGSSGRSVFNTWAPIFDKFNVDLVLSGHEHNFAPSKAIYQGEVAEKGYGTNYIVGPASGTKTGGFNRDFIFSNNKPLSEFFLNDEVGTVNLNFSRAGILIRVGANDTKLEVFNAEGILYEYSIPTRRPNSFFEIEKDKFMKKIKVEHDEEEGTAKIVWGEDAYGNVKTVKITNGPAVTETFISTPLFVERSIGKVYDGNVYRIQVEVTFTDDTVEEKELVLNLSGEDIEDPEKPEKPKPQPAGCQMGSGVASIIGLVTGLAGVVFVLKRKR